MPNLTIVQHDETLDDGTKITWPATQGNTLAFSGGEYILGNRGTQLSYTSADGGTTITFGAYLSGTSFVGTTTGTSPNQWDGPYALIDPTTVDLNDPGFHDIEKVGDISYFQEPDGSYGVHIDAADLVYGSGIADNAIQLSHNHPASFARGNFSGGAGMIYTDVAPSSFALTTTSPNSVIQFVTDDGEGDIVTKSASSNTPGAFVICASGGSTISASAIGYSSQALIGASGSTATTMQFPSNGIGNSNLAFCHYFPAEANTPTLFSSTGGSLVSGTWCVRYCYYKSVTLDAMVSKATITNGERVGTNSVILDTVTPQNFGSTLTAGSRAFLRGGTPETLTVASVVGTTVTFTTNIQYSGHKTLGWGSYQQVIESALSTPADITVSTGTGTNQIQVVIPDPPSGWSGPELFLQNGGWQTGFPFARILSPTDYTKSGTTYTIFHVGAAGTSSYPMPSHGFSAWPPGTLLVKDPNAAANYLMKIGHVEASSDVNSTGYQIVGWQTNTTQVQTPNLAQKSVTTNHLKTTNSPSAGTFLKTDGSNILWSSVSGSGSFSNGGVTFTLDSSGHLSATGGNALSFATAFPNTWFSGGVIFTGSNDIKGRFSLIARNPAVGYSGGTSASPGANMVVFNWGQSFSSSPIIILTPANWDASKFLAYPVFVSLSQWAIAASNSVTPVAGSTLTWNYHVIQ